MTLPQAAKARENVGLVDPKLPAWPGRTLGDAQMAASLQHIGTLCM